MTVKEILNIKIEELKLQECTCASTTPTENSEIITIKCDRCKQIEELEAKCTCGTCVECLTIVLEYQKTLPCECTYKEVESEIIDEETGEVTTTTQSVKDIICDRCVKIEHIQKVLSNYALMKKANIDECDYSKYEVIDNVIIAKEVRTIEEILAIKLQELKDYKWEKLEYITFNGHTNKWVEKDKILALESVELIEKGMAETIKWVHADGAVVEANAEYLTNLRLMGGIYTECGFGTELYIKSIMSKITNAKELLSYNYKSAFDDYFESTLQQMTSK